MEYSSKKPLVSAPAGFEPVPIPKNPHEDVDSMRVIGPADTDAMRVNPSPNDPTLQAFAHEILHETKLDAKPAPTFSWTEKRTPEQHKRDMMLMAHWWSFVGPDITDNIGDHEAIKKNLEEARIPIPLVMETTDFKIQIAPPNQVIKLLVKESKAIQVKFSPSEEALFKALEEAGWYEAIMGPDDRGVRGMSREEAEAAGHIAPIGEKGEVSQCWNGDPRLNPKRGVGPSKEELLAIYEEIAEDDFKKAMNTSAPGFDPNKYADKHKAELDAIWQRIIDRNKAGGAS